VVVEEQSTIASETAYIPTGILPVTTSHDHLNDQAVTYVSGYITRKWLRKNPCPDCRTLLNKDTVSCPFLRYKEYTSVRVGLTKPATLIKRALSAVERVFTSKWDETCRERGVMRRFLDLTKHIPFPTSPCHPHMRDFFVRSYLRLRIHQKCRLMTLAVRSQRKHVLAIGTHLKKRAQRHLLRIRR